MPAKNRTTLKHYFQKGRLPSEDEFADLIDSMLNMRDEGFEKDEQQGFMVGQYPEGRSITFFEGIPIESPVWSLKIDLKSGDRKLSFLNEKDEAILTLIPGTQDQNFLDGKVGIRKNQPDFDLDVAGTIASQGRIGGKGSKTVHANGYWQSITDTLEGCHAFEIMAGVGKPKSGKYALLHAFALKAFDAKGMIAYHQAHFGSRCNRIKLRWKKEPDQKYTLQLKTSRRYAKGAKTKKGEDKAQQDVGVYVKYYITQLWFDELMEECLNP
jgi:hypothetical protein